MLFPYLEPGRLEAGCDEAGRGCLAGPVVAAAVILPEDFTHPVLNDSKQLTLKEREELRLIIEKAALSFAVSFVSPEKIDEVNILNASFLGMHQALSNLRRRPEHILVDGNRFKAYKKIGHTCIVQGDGKYMSIAAASVLAKTYRDDYMVKLHRKFPHFNWKQNKGYPTPEHRQALLAHGVTEYHRKSFTLLPDQYELEFEDDVKLTLLEARG